jgi:hypothetical protein
MWGELAGARIAQIIGRNRHCARAPHLSHCLVPATAGARLRAPLTVAASPLTSAFAEPSIAPFTALSERAWAP